MTEPEHLNLKPPINPINIIGLLMKFVKEITAYTTQTYNSYEIHSFLAQLVTTVGINERHITIIIILLTRFVYFHADMKITPTLLLFIAYYHADSMTYDNPLDLKQIIPNLGLSITRDTFIDLAIEFAQNIKWKLDISISPQAWNTVWDFLHSLSTKKSNLDDVNNLIYKLCFIFKAWDNVHQNGLIFDEKFPVTQYKLSMSMLDFYYARIVNPNHHHIKKAFD